METVERIYVDENNKWILSLWLIHNWITKNNTQGKRRELQWPLSSIIEDLDYADDLGLLSNRHQYIQQKAKLLGVTSNKTGLKGNTIKTQVLRVNTTNKNNPVLINSKPIKDVEESTSLGSKFTTTTTAIRKSTQGSVRQTGLLLCWSPYGDPQHLTSTPRSGSSTAMYNDIADYPNKTLAMSFPAHALPPTHCPGLPLDGHPGKKENRSTKGDVETNCPKRPEE